MFPNVNCDLQKLDFQKYKLVQLGKSSNVEFWKELVGRNLGFYTKLPWMKDHQAVE